MKISELLSGVEKCQCGKSHICPIKHVFIGRDAISEIVNTTKDYSSILLVADENTYKVGGCAVEELIGDKIKSRVIFDGAPLLVPNESAIDKIDGVFTEGTDLVVGIGSGVINDLCKYVSYKHGVRYHIVATAPSMDGYASKGAALILGGMKVTLNAEVPEAIIADTGMLKTAPHDMVLAGYGDILGKYSCLFDWKLSSIVNDEYICDFVVNATYEEVKKVHRLAKEISNQNEDALASLTEALVAVGILMAYVGNSRPASGSEHHLSHYFEIVGIVRGEKYLPHGIDVFYSAVETAKIREALLSVNIDETVPKSFNKEEYEKNVRRIYKEVAPEVIALQNKIGWYEEIEKRISIYKNRWSEIVALIKEAPTSEEMLKMLSEVGMSYSDFVDFYGEDKIKDAYLYAKDLKDRYSVLWTYYDFLH